MARVSLILSVVVAAVLADDCLSPPSVKNFQRNKFAGTWSYQLVVGNTLLGPLARCMTASFEGSDKYKFTIAYEKDGQHGIVQGEETGSKGGAFSYKFNGKDIKVVVLDTDYSTYQVSYFCKVENATQSTVEVFLRSRERNDALVEQKLREAQKIVHITKPRAKADQSNCSK